MATLLQDLKFGLRVLARNPGFAVVAIITLALGIGANTAIFSVVEGVLLAPLPYAQPSRLVRVYDANAHFAHMSNSYLNFKDWQRDAHSFESMAAFRWDGFNLAHPGPAEHVDAKDVSTGFFSTLGVSMALGREFTAQEDVEGGAPVAIISHSVWQKRFGASAGALGQSVTLDGKDYTIVGVLPQGFQFHGQAAVYIPLAQTNPVMLNNRSISPGIQTIALLKPGVTIAQASAEMAGIQRHLDQLYPEADEGLAGGAMSLKQDIVGDLSSTLLMLLGAVGLVLLIACANVANLLLARAAARNREFAVRSALGANRGRVIRQLLTESVLLAIAGGAAGLLVASWGIKPILAAVPGSLPRSQNIGLNIPVLLFTFGVAIVVGILFGLAPALKASRSDLQEALKEGGRTSSTGQHRAQRGLVVFQIALTLVLLVGAGLMFRTVRSLWNVNPGFEPKNVITFNVGLSPSLTKTPETTRLNCRQLLDRIRSVPGARSVAVTTLVPLSGNDSEIPFWRGSVAPQSIQKAPWTLLYVATPDYLRVMGIPLLRGRFFTREDTTTSPPVVVIDRTLARKFFPGENPVGQTLTLGLLGKFQVIGVVGHVRHWDLQVNPKNIQNEMYLSFYQVPDKWMKVVSTGLTWIVNTPSNPTQIMPAIRQVVYGAGSDQPVYGVQTMHDIVSSSMSDRRFPMILLGAFALLALVLASVGIYGVMSYSVSQRAHEIGIRMALGAKKADVLRMVIGAGAKLAAVGVAIGIVGGLILTRLLDRLLYGVGATNPGTFVGVSLVLMGVALFACYIPARRAAEVDPMVALRYE